MKFKLTENFADFELEEELLTEGYSELWSQFNELKSLGVDSKTFELHHIYDPKCSEYEGKINYVILPKRIHKSLAKKRNKDQAIAAYQRLKSNYDAKFTTILVPFEIFTPAPEQEEEIIDDLKQETNARKRESKRIYRERQKQLKNNSQIQVDTEKFSKV